MAGWIARAVRALALCGMAGCAGHHGPSKASAGRSAGEAGSTAELPEGGRESVPEAGSSGSPQPETAGRGPSCELPIGECFTALPLAPSIGWLRKADIDGDGDLDVIAPGGSMAGGWVENAPSPTWHALDRPMVSAVLEYGDVTGDRIADAVGVELVPCGDCKDTLALRIAEGNGTGRFAESTPVETCPVGFSSWKFWLADLDGNGDSEYLLDASCGDEPQQLRVFDGPFADWKALHVSVEALAAADIDGDTHVDLVAVEHPFPAPPRLIVMRGEGGLRFSAVTAMAPLPEEHGREVEILDLDGDGGRDIVVLGGDTHEYSWLEAFRWSAGGLDRVQMLRFQGSFYRIAVANTDADCGDELIALRAESASFGPALLVVDPASGSTRPAQFPSGQPIELTTLLSVPVPDTRDHRVFAHTTLGELVELAPTSCGPPIE